MHLQLLGNAIPIYYCLKLMANYRLDALFQDLMSRWVGLYQEHSSTVHVYGQLIPSPWLQNHQRCTYLCCEVLEKLAAGRDNTAPPKPQYFKTLQDPSRGSKSPIVIHSGTPGVSCGLPTSARFTSDTPAAARISPTHFPGCLSKHQHFSCLKL